MSKEILQQAEAFVKTFLENDTTGHDWWHIHRVRQTTLTIAREEGADLFVCELAALLHDVADEKLNESEEAGLQKVEQWLRTQPIEAQVAEQVMYIITNLSFKGGNRPPIETLEGKVVQDADRLDALGAIGIARTFTYAGAHGQAMHDPFLQPRQNMTHKEYRHGKSTAINHFHEKLLKLKEKMNTRYGRQLAEERHQFMLEYLKRFEQEWNGES